MNVRALLSAGFLCVATTARAQSPMTGYWTVTSKVCVPASGRCTGPDVGSWSAQVAIDAQLVLVVITTPHKSGNPLGPGHVDSLRVDGGVMAWLPKRRGIFRRSANPLPSDTYTMHYSGMRALFPGETWTVSNDEQTLVHELKWTTGKDSTRRATWTYHRQQ